MDLQVAVSWELLCADSWMDLNAAVFFAKTRLYK